MTAFDSLTRRIGKHALIYATMPLFTFGSSIASLIVLTRFLPPSAYGNLAVMLVFSGFLTMLFNLGSLQGTFPNWLWCHGRGRRRH